MYNIIVAILPMRANIVDSEWNESNLNAIVLFNNKI